MTALANAAAGLGCGAGIDSLIASTMVGPTVIV
jgi:hypothetical protein